MHEAGPERCAASHSHITAQLRNPCTSTAWASRTSTHAQTPWWSHCLHPHLYGEPGHPGAQPLAPTKACLHAPAQISSTPQHGHPDLTQQSRFCTCNPLHADLEVVTHMHTCSSTSATAAALTFGAFLCLRVCVPTQEPVHSLQSQQRVQTWLCVCRCPDVSAQTLVSGEVQVCLAEVVLWCALLLPWMDVGGSVDRETCCFGG